MCPMRTLAISVARDGTTVAVYYGHSVGSEWLRLAAQIAVYNALLY